MEASLTSSEDMRSSTLEIAELRVGLGAEDLAPNNLFIVMVCMYVCVYVCMNRL